MKTTHAATAALLALSPLATGQATNLVTNGSFESHSCLSRVSGSCMTGWTVSPLMATSIAWVRNQASDGKVGVELDADDAPIYLTQTVHLLRDMTYTLEFDLAAATNARQSNIIDVRVAGVTRSFTVPANSAFKTYTITFRALSSSTELRFWNRGNIFVSHPGAVLDNVRLYGPAGKFETYGSGCHGVHLSFAGDPVIGKAIHVALRGAKPNGLAILSIGRSRTMWGTFSLPLALDGIGAPACSLYNSSEIGLGVSAAADGRSTARLLIPNHPTLLGRQYQFQWSAYDPSFNRLGFAFSNGGQVSIGL